MQFQETQAHHTQTTAAVATTTTTPDIFKAN